MTGKQVRKIWGWNPSMQKYEECDAKCMRNKQYHSEHVTLLEYHSELMDEDTN